MSLNQLSQKIPMDESLSKIIPILNNVLYNIALYRTLFQRYSKDVGIFEPFKREFWITNANNSIQMAILNWCKVFGAKSNKYPNPLHYTNCIDKIIGLRKLASELITFRNKYIAHRDCVIPQVPEMEKAIEIIHIFEKAVQKKYELNSLPSFDTTYEAYVLRIEDILDTVGLDEY